MTLALACRRTHVRAAAVVAAGALALAGCMSLQPQSPTRVGAAQSGGAVHLRQGDTLVVALASDPSARTRWQPQPLQGAVLQQIGMSDLLPQQIAQGTVGDAGDTVYRFRANEVGTTKLDLALQSPFSAVAPQRTVHYDVSVTARPGEYAQAWAKTR